MISSRLGLRVGMAIAASVLGLVACELAARMIFPAPPDTTREPQIVYRYDPELKYVNMPNQQGWIDDGFVTINSLGFRGGPIASPKPAERFRVVFIGDSLTLGWGVGEGETFASEFERLLHRTFPVRDLDVINLGVAGYNTRQEVALLKRNVASLEPNLVLVGFYSNDVPDALEDGKPAATSGTRVIASHPKAGQVLHILNTTPSSWWDRQLRRSRAIFTVGRTLKRLTGNGEWGTSHFSMELDLLQGKQSESLDRAWATVERQFGELRSAAAAGRFRVGIVVLPCREQVTGQFPSARYQSRVREIADKLGFFVIDPLPSLAGRTTNKDRLFIPYDRNHPSADGHRIIAQAIFDYFQGHEKMAGVSGEGGLR